MLTDLLDDLPLLPFQVHLPLLTSPLEFSLHGIDGIGQIVINDLIDCTQVNHDAAHSQRGQGIDAHRILASSLW
jgi:hypothetical protein